MTDKNEIEQKLKMQNVCLSVSECACVCSFNLPLASFQWFSRCTQDDAMRRAFNREYSYNSQSCFSVFFLQLFFCHNFLLILRCAYCRHLVLFVCLCFFFVHSVFISTILVISCFTLSFLDSLKNASPHSFTNESRMRLTKKKIRTSKVNKLQLK